MNVPKTIEQNGQRVLTTKTLAEMYGTSTQRISHNFNQNKKRYVEGKHFYYLTGESLKEFAVSNLGTANKGGKLYLWTERGALLHAKSLNTDKAWEVYDFLVDHYFCTKAPALPAKPMPSDSDTLREQKRLAALVGELRFRQSRLAEAEAQFAKQKAEIAWERSAFADWIMLHPELMPYANYMLPVNE